jgi:anti-anti-sigma factor
MLLLRVVRPGGGGGLFRLFGELDASSVAELDTVLRHARGGGDVVLDLADLTFIDSAGIKGFIEIARAVGTGRKLILLSPRPVVARVLRFTGIAEALPNLVVIPTHDHDRRDGPRRAKPAPSHPATTSMEPAAVAASRRTVHGGTDADDLPFIWLG